MPGIPSDDERRRREAAERLRQARADLERGRGYNRQGVEFHEGMAQIRGETRENGWRNEVVTRTTRELGDRRHDTARLNSEGGKDFREYKSGQIRDDRFTRDEIAKDRHILAHDPHAQGQWIIRADARVDPGVQRELERLARDFPGRFSIVQVTPVRARRAIELGQALSRERQSRQLELPGVNAAKLREKARREQEAREKARVRAERARVRVHQLGRYLQRGREGRAEAVRARELEQQRQARERTERERKARELETKKKDLARVVGENTKAIARARDEGKVFPARELREAHENVTRALHDVQEKQKAQTREMLADAGFTGEQGRIMAEHLAERQARQRESVVLGIEAIGKEATVREAAEHEDRRDAEWKAQQRARELRARQLVREGRISPELARGLEAVHGGLVRHDAPLPPGMSEFAERRGAREREARGRARERGD